MEIIINLIFPIVKTQPKLNATAVGFDTIMTLLHSTPTMTKELYLSPGETTKKCKQTPS